MKIIPLFFAVLFASAKCALSIKGAHGVKGHGNNRELWDFCDNEDVIREAIQGHPALDRLKKAKAVQKGPFDDIIPKNKHDPPKALPHNDDLPQAPPNVVLPKAPAKAAPPKKKAFPNKNCGVKGVQKKNGGVKGVEKKNKAENKWFRLKKKDAKVIALKAKEYVDNLLTEELGPRFTEAKTNMHFKMEDLKQEFEEGFGLNLPGDLRDTTWENMEEALRKEWLDEYQEMVREFLKWYKEFLMLLLGCTACSMGRSNFNNKRDRDDDKDGSGGGGFSKAARKSAGGRTYLKVD